MISTWSRVVLGLLLITVGPLRGAVPVEIAPVTAPHGMVVAGHPAAAAAGVQVLAAGGNAIDAAIAVSLALNVAEPYGSGLGGKLMLLYYEAATGRCYAIEAMDQAGSVDPVAYLRRPDADHSSGYGAVCVPGLGAGLWLAHQRWGTRPWADDVAPALTLARDGFEVLPKTRMFFAEQEKKLRRGDAEIARLYLPGGQLPEVGSTLANPDLAETLGRFAREGRDGFYRGPVAEAIVHASEQAGGSLTLADLADYEVHVTEPLQMEFRGYRLLASPPPTSGAPLLLTIMKVLEEDTFAGGPLRTVANLDRIGRVWRQVLPLVQKNIADVPAARLSFEQMVAPEAITRLREKVRANVMPEAEAEAAWLGDDSWTDNAMAATTHFAVADAAGNLVCATQSLSLHFGAGVVAPGTGVVLNNSMSNFAYRDATSVNYLAPGKRPRSTIAPLIVFSGNRPLFAMGIPGASRIPTALLQTLLDRLVLNRPLAEAIGDTRMHFTGGALRNAPETIEAEQSLDPQVVAGLAALGWRVQLPEPAGRGQHFGGINVIACNVDGSYTGYADPRRTNAAQGR